MSDDTQIVENTEVVVVEQQPVVVVTRTLADDLPQRPNLPEDPHQGVYDGLIKFSGSLNIKNKTALFSELLSQSDEYLADLFHLPEEEKSLARCYAKLWALISNVKV